MNWNMELTARPKAVAQLKTAKVEVLRDENRRLVSALHGCVASLQGYRRELNDGQPCDAEKMAISLLTPNAGVTGAELAKRPR